MTFGVIEYVADWSDDKKKYWVNQPLARPLDNYVNRPANLGDKRQDESQRRCKTSRFAKGNPNRPHMED